MAFPTIPTAAAGRVLTNTQPNTTATRTFPSLTGLTKNAGDLLIAIVVGYNTSTGTNAAFSGWSSGWTEFHDSATNGTMPMGAAYKWSTGSETGTISVTQAATITGHAGMILLSIPGAHATTPPEAGSRASGTSTAADCASFDPAGWGAEDTLWISVAGCGETGTGGAFQGMAGAGGGNPANYGDNIATGISADAVGGLEGGAYFRQLNAAAEDVGPTSPDTSNARNGAFVIAVRPAPSATTYPQAIPATSTFTPALARQLSLLKTIPATSTLTPAVSRQLSLNKSLAVATTLTTSISKSIPKILSATASLAPVIGTQFVVVRSLDAVSTIATSIQKRAQKNIAATSSLVAVVGRQLSLNRTLAAASTLSAATQKQVNKAISATTSLASSISTGLSFNKTLAVTSTMMAGMAHGLVFLRNLAATTTMNAAVATANAFNQAISATSTLVAELVTEYQAGGGGLPGLLKSFMSLLGVGR